MGHMLEKSVSLSFFVCLFGPSFCKHSAHLMLSGHQDSSPTAVSPWITNLAVKIAQPHQIYRRMEALGGLIRPKGNIRADDGTSQVCVQKGIL